MLLLCGHEDTTVRALLFDWRVILLTIIISPNSIDSERVFKRNLVNTFNIMTENNQ